MKKTIASTMIFSLAISLSTVLTACHRQESNEKSLAKTYASSAVTVPQVSNNPKMAFPSNAADIPAIIDLLSKVVRPDIPSMTYDQKKNLFPSTCVANDENFTISCPSVEGLISIRTDNGPDGSLSMVFSGGMASCKMLQKFVNKKFGTGADMSAQNKDGVCDVTWEVINPKNKKYHASLGKLKGDDEVTLLIDADDPVGP